MDAKLVGWAEVKAFADARSLSIQWIDLGDTYWLKAFDGFFALETVLHKTDQAAETGVFEASYKALGNALLQPKNPDARVMVHSTPRKRGMYTYFTSGADSQADHSAIGGAGATAMKMAHATGGGAIAPIYIDFNTIANESHTHAGWIMWKDALLDEVTLSVVPKLSTYEAGSNTNFNLYGGYLIIPAAGTGTITPLTMVLVEVPVTEYGIRQGAGYWNATYNTTTKLFENITAAPLGNGQFNMFTVEVTLARFLNRMVLLGSGFLALDTFDATMYGHNMRMRVDLTTVGDDHDWWWSGGLRLYRRKTV